MMNRLLHQWLAVWLAAALILPAPGWIQAQDQQAFSPDELDDLLAPIALYPDPLLAQMLPAATFVDQIDAAARWLRAGNDPDRRTMPSDWDLSVQSLAHYPDIIYKMSAEQDWTIALGQAYVQQQADVMVSIQRLRVLADKMGNLKTTPQQTVVVEKEVIKIVPAEPTVIYVPQYNPQVVYVQAPPPPGPSTGTIVATALISFGVGLAIGAWLNNDCDWYHHHVYYHGWVGGGWIGYCGPHVHYHGSVWIRPGWKPGYTHITVNRTVVHRPVHYNNIAHYNVNRTTNVNVNRTTNVNVNRTTNVHTNRFTGTPPSATRNAQTNRTTQPAHRSTAQPATRSTTQPAHRSTAQPATRSTTQPAHRSTAQPATRSATPPAKQTSETVKSRETTNRSGSSATGQKSSGEAKAGSKSKKASQSSGDKKKKSSSPKSKDREKH
jgi:hypothetical protein